MSDEEKETNTVENVLDIGENTRNAEACMDCEEVADDNQIDDNNQNSAQVEVLGDENTENIVDRNNSPIVSAEENDLEQEQPFAHDENNLDNNSGSIDEEDPLQSKSEEGVTAEDENSSNNINEENIRGDVPDNTLENERESTTKDVVASGSDPIVINNDEDVSNKSSDTASVTSSNRLKNSEETEVVELDDEDDEQEKESCIVLDENKDETNEEPVAVQIFEKQQEKEMPANEKDDDENENEMVRVRMDGIFESQDDEDDVIALDDDSDSEKMDPTDVQSMLQMSFQEGDFSNNIPSEVPVVPEESPGRRPRRAAAAAAANTIREISNKEQLDSDTGELDRRRGRTRDNEDTSYSEATVTGRRIVNNSAPNKCHICQRWSTCEYNIQQFGTTIFICTHDCFNVLQKKRLAGNSKVPCVKCGTIQNSNVQVMYYWETMNFCSEMCVGNYQMDIGGTCATCIKNVPWTSLGKYCVRFGSDIRQFCTASCLESYKKNARVCFHCQLDIKRLGNVILANIPSKTTPKEFCSQDCVEMYVEQNLNQTVKSKSNQLFKCAICTYLKPCFKELVLPTDAAFKVCSSNCWTNLVQAQQPPKEPVKCESCTKFVYIDYAFTPPTHYVSTKEKIYGFCSATCKNVFVLKSRKILACTSCKVKKYNFDLVQYFAGREFTYAVCSLNCLPKGVDHISRLRQALLQEAHNRQRTSTENNIVARQNVQTQQTSMLNSFSSTQTQPHVGNLLNSDLVIDNFGNITSLGGSAVVSTVALDDVSQLADMLNMEPSELEKLVKTANEADEKIEKEFIASWDGILRPSDIETLLNVHFRAPEMKTKFTMAKPFTATIETQTDESCLSDMERIPLKTVEKVRYVPMPIPYPVYVPTPTYLMETPTPFPFPLPIPVPIPIPLIFNNYSTGSKSTSGIQEVEMLEVESSGNGNNDLMENLDNVEMMDCSSPGTEQTHAELSCTSDHRVNDSDSQLSNSANPETPLSAVPLSLPTGNSQDAVPSPIARKKLTRVEYGIRAWKMSFGQYSDPHNLNVQELSDKLVHWVNKGAKPNGERYRADIFVYLCLGIQQHLLENNRLDSIFYDYVYSPFVEAITNYAESDCAQGISTRIEDVHFWESKQLGNSSPGVLIFTLIYFLSKYFNLKTWEKQSSLHFGQIKIFTKYEFGMLVKYLKITEVPECDNIEIREKTEDPQKCPVKLMEFYLSKCEQPPDGPFYKAINPTFDEMTNWFTDETLDQMKLYQMLVRALMIKTDSELR